MPDITTIDLVAGNSFDLQYEVHHTSVGAWTHLPLRIRTQGQHVEVFDPIVDQAGPNVLVRHVVSVQRKFSTETVSLTAQVQSSEGSPVGTGAAPEFQILLRIRPPRFFHPFIFGSVFWGSIFVNATKEMMDMLGWAGWGLLLTKAAGGALLALATFYALRRLPIGKP
jgi:hypothetical protein